MSEERATRARNVVWLMFDEPVFTAARLIEAAHDFAPDLSRDDLAAAVVAQLNRGRLTLNGDGLIERVEQEAKR